MARSFNGTSDKIAANGAQVAGNAGGFLACTVAAWVKCAGTVTNADFYAEGNSGDVDPFWRMQCNSGKLRVFIRRDTNGGTSDVNGLSSALTCADGTWHHVVFAQDGGAPNAYQAYIDGVADGTLAGTVTNHGCTVNTVTFGALTRTTVSNFWTGTLGEIASWSRRLTAGEILSLAAGLPASHLAPAHYWLLWGVDSPEPDIGNG